MRLGTARLARPIRLGVLLVVSVGFISVPGSARGADDGNAARSEADVDENEFHAVGRIRAIGIPNFMIGAAFEKHSAHWRGGRANVAYGAEFVWRKIDAFELSVAAEYADLSMRDDWWLQRGDRAGAAEYVDFDLGMASLVFSGYWYWDVARWFSPYVGGGLGVGVLFNDVRRYELRRRASCKRNLGQPGGGFGGEHCFEEGNRNPQDSDDFEDGEIDDDLWSVAPVINLTAGARFNIEQHGVVKVEVGFYDYVFAGISGGARW